MVATCSATVAPFLPTCSPCRRTVSRHFWCSCSGGRVDRPGGSEAPRLLKIAISGVTGLLRLLPAAPRKERDDSGGREEGPPIRSIEDVVSILRADYKKAYFLTGRDRYSQNLDLLVQFFDRPSLVLEKIEKCVDDEREFVLATWILRTYLRLPWTPLICIGGTTTYDLDDKFRIVRHAERWNVSAVEAVGQIFTPSRNNGR